MLLPEHRRLADKIREAHARSNRKQISQSQLDEAVAKPPAAAAPIPEDPPATRGEIESIMATLSAAEVEIIEQQIYDEIRSNNLLSQK